MKYIRTKDGIYDTSEMKWCECSKHASYYKDKNYMLYVPLKQADTIPELCDAFIITSKQGHLYDTYGRFEYEIKYVLPQAKIEEPDEDWNLYGVIIVNGIIKVVSIYNETLGKMELI